MRARPAPRPPPAGAGSAGGGEGPPSGSVGALRQIVRPAQLRSGRQRPQAPSGTAAARRSTRGSRRTRSASALRALGASAQVELVRDAPACAGGLRRSGARRPRPAVLRTSCRPGPQRDRLAVHRAARGDHEIGVGDQRLRVDRVLGHDEARHRRELGALGVHARQHHRLHAVRRGGRGAGARAPARTGRSRSGGTATPPAAGARRRSAGRSSASSPSTAASGSKSAR